MNVKRFSKSNEMCVEVFYELQSESEKLSISNKCVLKCAREYKVRHLRWSWNFTVMCSLLKCTLENKVRLW